MPTSDPAFIFDLLRLFAEEDLIGSLYWVEDGDSFQFFVGCNDVFAWGCADGEDITLENLPQLRQAITDAKAADPVMGSIYGCHLFVARVRGMRPQGAAYPKEQALWPLFDACGPEREVGFGNPCRPGEGK